LFAGSAVRWAPGQAGIPGQSPATCRFLPRSAPPGRGGLRRAFLLLALLPLATPGWLQAQSEVRVLVAPLTTGAGVDRTFGYKVAEEVRKGLDDFDATTPLKNDEVDDALERFGLAYQILTPIQWTAIATQLDAELVMVGNADATGSGVEVRAMFIQATSGDELPIPDFTVPDDGDSSAKEASGLIIEAFDAQLAHEESLDPPRKVTSDAAKEDCRVWSAVVENRSDQLVQVFAWPDGDVVKLATLSDAEIQHRRGALLLELQPNERASITLEGTEPVLLVIRAMPAVTGRPEPPRREYTPILIASPREREVNRSSDTRYTARDLRLDFSCAEENS